MRGKDNRESPRSLVPAVPGSRTVTAAFSEHVQQTPQAVALVTGDGHTLAYAELDARANAVAARLAALGIGAEEAIGLSVTGAERMVTGALGILKAGGVYLPIDVAYPAERRAAMIADARVNVVIVDSATATRYANLPFRILNIDAIKPAECEGVRPGPDVHEDSLAYVVFTSGSTRRPRGVTVTHRSIVNLVRGQPYIDLDHTRRVAQVSSHSFDAVTFEIWGALLNGAALVEVPRKHLLDADQLRSVLRERSITTLLVTTALFNRLVDEDPSCFAPLDDLLFGGEAVDPRRVAQVLATAPPRRLLHVYGPTETTALSTWRVVQHVEPDDETVPIGTALDGYDLHVLNEEMQPVPEQGVGELYIGGEGLARGYVNSPAETAARFVPDPHSATPGRRLYRTGDLVRLLPSGALAFVRRVDSQVKVSGCRIELGEVEAAIQRHSDVAAAAVLVDERDEVRILVACVQPRAGTELDVRALRTAFSSVLPEFMVPRRIVLLRELPLSTNGKVDRVALRGRISEPAGEADRLDLFETVAAICRSVLGTSAIYREDSFIDLGGHSLAAMRVIGRVRKQFGVRLKVASLLDPTATIGDIADFIAEHGRVATSSDGGAACADPNLQVTR